MVQWLVFMGLLVLKELVESVGLEDPLGLVGEEDRVSVEGHAELGLRHLRHLLRREHGSRSDPWWRGAEHSHRFVQLIRSTLLKSQLGPKTPQGHENVAN